MKANPRLLTTKQYAARHGMPWRTVQRLCRDGYIEEAQKVGGFWILAEDAKVSVHGVVVPAHGQPYPEPV
jgi:hypothetical protein